MSTPTEQAAAPSVPPPRNSPWWIAQLARVWRDLTSMRVALVLLFLLALAALPGALLPQRSLNAAKVDAYIAEYPTWGPLLNRLGFFEVFASPWFAAIYLLLFVSLVGCLVPRSIEQARALRATPPATPRNLSRLPHHGRGTVDAGVDGVLDDVRGRLGGWRTVERDEPGGVRTLSAEKGFLHEAGNLVFHIALVGLLVGIALGKLFGYEGQVIVLAGGGQFCNTGILGYDSFRAGLRVDGTNLDPFCLRVDDFAASYLPNGQPDGFRAQIGYQTSGDIASGASQWQPYELEVNQPLRLDGERVYLLGHGYAPTFTVTYPDGTKRTSTVQWRPVDNATLLSEGTTKFDRPGLTDEADRRRNQLAITGLFAPTSSGGQIVGSVFPDLRDPQVAVDVYRGDLGLDDGRGQSIFTVDRKQVESGALTKVARQNVRPGEQVALDDGTTIRFDDVRQWVSLQVSYDPGQTAVLVFATLLLLGLGLSLTIKRRRFWVRLTPTGEGDPPRRTVVEIGGLARTDRAGYGEEFSRLRTELLGPLKEE